jgi:hypothetical protein
MTYPKNYQRVHIANSELDWVPLRATIQGSSYDSTYAIRYEFFYYENGETMADAMKIDETNIDTLGYAEVLWDNSDLTEGWYWLFSVVHDDFDNVDTSCAVKVYLDGTAPLMQLTAEPMVYTCDMWNISTSLNGGIVDLVAHIQQGDSMIDIGSVEFFIAYEDSADMAKWYHRIGAGTPSNNSSLWTFSWDVKYWADTIDWMNCWSDYKLRIKVTDIAGNVLDDMDGDGLFDDYTFWDDPVAQTAPADISKLLFRLNCGASPVSIYEFASGGFSRQTPSSLRGGPDMV